MIDSTTKKRYVLLQRLFNSRSIFALSLTTKKQIKMTIYTHPEEIKAISQKTSGRTLYAYTANFNYHLVDGNLYSVFQEGLGNYPELIIKDQIHSQAIYVATN